MTIQKQKISIGAIQPITKGTYNPTLGYNYLNIVSTENASYICCNRLGAPAGVSISDTHYWQCLVRDGLDGAVTFASSKDFDNETKDKAIDPALIRPKLIGLQARQKAFEEYGKAYDSYRLDGKSIEEVRAGINAATLSGLTLDKILGTTVEGSLRPDGWVKFANGLIIQWGTAEWANKAAAVKTITLPTKFTVQNLWAIVAPYVVGGTTWADGSEGGSYISWPYCAYISAKTLTTLTLSRPGTAAATIPWLAIGY